MAEENAHELNGDGAVILDGEDVGACHRRLMVRNHCSSSFDELRGNFRLRPIIDEKFHAATVAEVSCSAVF